MENKPSGMTPKMANTFRKICKLKRDNVSTSKSWILIGEKGVSIHNQKNGESSTGKVYLTRKEFERFINFYETGH